MKMELNWDVWFACANADPEFALVSRWSDLRLRLVVDGAATDLRLAASQLSRDTGGGDAGTVVLEGAAAAWGDFLKALPERHNHHVLAMNQCRDDFRIADGFHVLVRNLSAITVALELLRESVATRAETSHD